MNDDLVRFIPALAVLIGYLLGSIPFGILLTRAGGAGDLRQIGSGNIGATNVLRTGRKGLAAATLVLDALKGAVAVLIGQALGENYGVAEAGVLAGIAAFAGHCFPVWLRFRGGKGVATLFGIAVALAPLVGLVYAVIWIGGLAILRISSVAGMLAAIGAPIVAAALGRFDLVLVLLATGAIVLLNHRENIDRLLDGTEPRIGTSKA